jgi:hypothetical protein
MPEGRLAHRCGEAQHDQAEDQRGDYERCRQGRVQGDREEPDVQDVEIAPVTGSGNHPLTGRPIGECCRR